MYVPELHLEVPGETVHLEGYQKKKFWFVTIKGKFTSTSKVQPGEITATNGEICAVFKTTLEGDSPEELRPKTDLVKVEYPEFGKLSIEGLKVTDTKVKIHGFLASLVSKILKWFGVLDIPEMIQKQVQKEIQKKIDKELKVSVDDVKKGRWFAKAIEGKLSKSQLTRDVFRTFRSSISGSTNRPRVFKKRFVDECMAVMGSLERQYNVELKPSAVRSTCRNLVVEVSVLPFARPAKYVDRGCYNHFFALGSYTAARKDPSWLHQCALSTRITVEGPDISSRTRNCLFNQFVEGASRSEILAACQGVAITELTGIRSINHFQQIVGSVDPIAVMLRLGYSQEQIRQIAAILGLGS